MKSIEKSDSTESSYGCGGAARNGNRQKSSGFIRGYQDLDVYKNAYSSMIDVYKDIIPKLPKSEYDLIDQIKRSCKAIPRLIAEGHSKRHQKFGFRKYIDDAMAESNETAVSISQAKDLCGKYVNREKCEQLIDSYDKISRQLYNLSVAWTKFQNKRTHATDER